MSGNAISIRGIYTCPVLEYSPALQVCDMYYLPSCLVTYTIVFSWPNEGGFRSCCFSIILLPKLEGEPWSTNKVVSIQIRVIETAIEC